MSIEIMTEVWKHAPCAENDLLVLLAIADSANDERECWPGLRAIARKTRITLKESLLIVGELELQGFIEIEHRKDARRSKLSNKYRVRKVEEWLLLWAYNHLNASTQPSIVGGVSNSPSTGNRVFPTKGGLETVVFPSKGGLETESSLEPKVNHNTSVARKQAPPKAPKATPTPKPMRLPDDVYKYQAKHIAQYQSEHSTSLDALVVAWGGLYRHITEMPLYDARQFVVAHQDLERMSIPPSDFGAIITTTRTKFAWRLLRGGHVNPSDIGATITDYLQAKQAQPSTSTSQADAQAEHAYREMFGKDMPHA